ncbi:putative MFS alpha-glucoside transporter [Eremomyces bilateralis CBS 781.70]|uniref:MFS alpha-glucoside transporter n=1 Tax=Eremomyces bilateralis CBS 781.70 TaxID=1392243 RepID=A0A6G1GGE0_9PEZI|nr:putative MFS alpha-glucoside transporter [Eremomyces bilateralis CBS 781.70]KAF1816996.1 putative MFS alpha-glucoside transporter [Eremomyces bilateralis CBS 781.70]
MAADSKSQVEDSSPIEGTPTIEPKEDVLPKETAKGLDFIIRDAKAATDKERKMTLMQGIRLYPKAVAWSILISTCIAMEGYDICLINNFYGFPEFKKKYGEQLPDGTWEIPARWQSGLSNGANVGEIIGLFINGWVSEKFGYRYTVMACLILIIGFTAIFFTAQTVVHLLVAEILCGIPWGVFQTLTITYASEVCPVPLRGYLSTYVNFCWGLGQVIGIGVIKSMLSRTDEWSYRIPYALQWMWPVPLLVGIYFAPESPWWLVRQGKTDKAKESLLRLTSKDQETNFDADETVAMMVHTTALEAKITTGASYFDCFRGVDRRRTEIVCMCWAIQNLSGNSFSGYSAYFMQQAGLDPSTSYSFALGQYGINMAGVFSAWFLMSRGIGRRSLYFYGLCGLFIMLFVLGFLGLIPDSHVRERSLATGSMMIGWAMIYQSTVGTVCYSLVSELSTRRLQIKTVVLGRNLYNVVGIVCAVLTPYMLNPGEWDWGNFAGFFWAGICFLCIVYTYFRLPEPMGRSFAELDLLFEQRVPARKFSKTDVDVFAEKVEGSVIEHYEEEQRRNSLVH